MAAGVGGLGKTAAASSSSPVVGFTLRLVSDPMTANRITLPTRAPANIARVVRAMDRIVSRQCT